MDEHFETFAQKICDFCMRRYVLPWMRDHGVVQSYRAQIVSKDTTSKTMVIQRPFDNQVTLPYASSASTLSAGDECVVFCLGSSTNSIVVSDGKFNLT